jgi:hypothetical protein
MVTAAEYQGVQWHMGLYYFPHFIRQIVALYDACGPDIDPNVEWPTRASHLIYQMFYVLTKWITAVMYLPRDSPHLILENDEVVHENGNIPKSATLALGMCLETLLVAPSVGQAFKQYSHEDIVMERMRDLSKTGVEGRLRALLIKTIVQGGLSKPTQDYGQELKRLFGATDHVARARVSSTSSLSHNSLGVLGDILSAEIVHDHQELFGLWPSLAVRTKSPAIAALPPTVGWKLIASRRPRPHGLHQRGNRDCCEIGVGVRDSIGQNDLVAVPHGSTCVDDVGDVPFTLDRFRPDQWLA